MLLRLTTLRTQLGLTKAELGRRAGLDGGVVSRIELGRLRPPSGSVTLRRIAAALGVPESESQQLIDPAEVTGAR